MAGMRTAGATGVHMTISAAWQVPARAVSPCAFAQQECAYRFCMVRAHQGLELLDERVVRVDLQRLLALHVRVLLAVSHCLRREQITHYVRNTWCCCRKPQMGHT